MTGWLGEQWRRFKCWLRRDQMARELADEMALHQQLKADSLKENHEPFEAAVEARRRFGSPTLFAEDSHAYWGWSSLDGLARDLRHGLRNLARDKSYSAAVALTLGVCVAANTVTFAVVHSVLLRPLPVPNAERMVLMANRYPGAGVEDLNTSSVGDYYDRLEAVPALEEQALFRLGTQTVEVSDAPEQMQSMAVTPSLFKLVSAKPSHGRLFQPEEGEIGQHQKVILSDGSWRRMYAGEPSAVGRELRVGGHPFTIVGILPPDFNFVSPDVQFWIPLAFTGQVKSGHHSNNWYHIGLLRRGSNIAQVQAQVDALNAANLDKFPESKDMLINAGFHTVVEPLEHMIVKDVESTIYLLWGGAVLVLLIGVLNIGSLMLARSSARRKEIATRLALGAGGLHLTRQLTMENLVVASFGGLIGVFGGTALLRTSAALGIDRLPRSGEVRIDGFVILVSVGLAVGLCLIVGLLPLVQNLRVGLSPALHEASRGGTDGVRWRLVRRGLVSAEIGMAFSLLFATGLLLATFRNLLNVDPGFVSTGVWTVSTNAPATRYPADADLRSLMNRLLQAMHGIPGVIAAGATTAIPLGGDYNDSVILAEGYEMRPGESVVSPRRSAVTPGYFEAMRIPLRHGRFFGESDDASALPVVIVDERLAERFWPNRDPIGRRMYVPNNPSLRINAETRWVTVVGVVGSVRLEDLAGGGNTVGAYYFPYAQDPSRGYTFAVKTGKAAASVERAIATHVAAVDRELALFDGKTMLDRGELSLSPRRTALILTFGFGGIALFLAGIGIYGVLSYLVAQRRREIGIRMALGGTRAGIMQLVMREGLVLVFVGLLLGCCGALAFQGVIAKEVYGVRPLNPTVIAAVTVTLMAVALAACWIPACRAANVDPGKALSES
ncbi:MAG: ABC transporter permease [Bryobacteraceae bacterium]